MLKQLVEGIFENNKGDLQKRVPSLHVKLGAKTMPISRGFGEHLAGAITIDVCTFRLPLIGGLELLLGELNP